MITFTEEQIASFDANELDMFQTLCAKHHAIVRQSEEEKSEEERLREERAKWIKEKIDKHFAKHDDEEHREWLEKQFEKGSVCRCY